MAPNSSGSYCVPARVAARKRPEAGARGMEATIRNARMNGTQGNSWRSVSERGGGVGAGENGGGGLDNVGTGGTTAGKGGGW